MSGDNDPIPAFSIDGNASDFSQAELDGIIAIWEHVSEKFSPFQINVTTLPPPNYNDGTAVHAIIGGNDGDWYNKGAWGVSPREGFTNSSVNSAFTFTADIITPGSTTLSDANRLAIAETIAHEVGHNLGLKHQSEVDGNNMVTDEYASGNATTVPIMGGSGTDAKQRNIWFRGPSSQKDNDNNVTYEGIQDDLAQLTRPGNFIDYRPDDWGAFSGSGSLSVDTTNGLANGAGIIERNGDQDAFTFVAIGPMVQFTVNNAPLGGMLAPTLELIPLGSGGSPSVNVTTDNGSATLQATNVVSGGGYVLRVSPQNNAYGNLGQYSITGNVGSFASLAANGTLHVAGFALFDNDLTITHIPSTNKIVVQNDVFGGKAVQQFDAPAVNQIVFDLPSRNDRINLLSPLGAYPTTVNGRSGTDTLILHGTSGPDIQRLLAGNNAINNSTPISFNGIEHVVLTTFDGNDTLDIAALAPSINVTVYGGGDSDTIDIGNGGSSAAIRSAITIHAESGNDVVHLARNTLSLSVIDAPVIFQGGAGADTLNIGGGGLHAVSGLVTYHAGAQGEGNALKLFDGANPFFIDYLIGDTSVTRDEPYFFGGVNFSGVGAITLDATNGPNTVTINSTTINSAIVHGNGGDDNFVIGNGVNLAGGIGLFTGSGGEGFDTLTLNDSLSTHNLPWAILGQGAADPETVYLGLRAYDTEGYEQVTVLAGNGSNNIQINGQFRQAITVNAGGGNDAFGINGAKGAAISVFGHDGFDTLLVDDRELLANIETISLYANRIVRDDFNARHTVWYDNIESLDFHQNQGQTRMDIYGTSPDIPTTHQTMVYGNASDNIVTIYPRDSNGNATIVSRLEIRAGGAGDDRLVINDAASSQLTNYKFSNPLGPTTTQVDGLGTEPLKIGNDFDSITIHAGAGNDTFQIDTFQSGSALAIFAGGGDDLLDITPTTKDVAISITAIAKFDYDGGDGSDFFNLYNEHGNGTWDYTRTSGALTTLRTSGPRHFLILNNANVELLSVTAGAQNDRFFIQSTPSGGISQFFGISGDDTYFLGVNQSTNGILGGVQVFNSEGTDSVFIDDRADTMGKMLHVEDVFVGGQPGDNLFGPGGFLYYVNITGAMTIQLGSGDDIVYAAPHPSTPINIEANDHTAHGDFLGLALVDAQNPVFVQGGPGEGQYSFDNRAPLYYSSMENTAMDDAAPYVVAQGYDETDGVPAIILEFSEDVSQALPNNYLNLVNTTTGEPVPFHFLELSYDTATNTARFTFPGYPEGRLADGDYTASLGQLPDLYGNLLDVPTPLQFTVNQLLEDDRLAGDVDGDGEVQFEDFLTLANNFGRMDAAAEDGDVNGDALVDFADFLILANNFGRSRRSLAAPSLASDLPTDDLPLPSATYVSATDAIYERFDERGIRVDVV